jgi:hypothetical protein
MELPDTHLEALRTIAGGHPDAERITPDILEDLRRWGMVVPHSLEVTGKRTTRPKTRASQLDRSGSQGPFVLTKPPQ